MEVLGWDWEKIETLREKLLAGRDSGPAARIDDAWLAKLRARAAGEIAE